MADQPFPVLLDIRALINYGLVEHPDRHAEYVAEIHAMLSNRDRRMIDSAFPRLVEVQELINNAADLHCDREREFDAQVEAMGRQFDRLYDNWLLNTGRREPRKTSADRPNGVRPAPLPQPPALEAISEL